MNTGPGNKDQKKFLFFVFSPIPFWWDGGCCTSMSVYISLCWSESRTEKLYIGSSLYYFTQGGFYPSLSPQCSIQIWIQIESLHFASCIFLHIFCTYFTQKVTAQKTMYKTQGRCRVRNAKFATYLKFATCGNTKKINELR